MLVGDIERRGLGVPERPVEVVGVLPVAAVKRHEPRAVHAVGAPRGAVIEQVVDPHAPEERIPLQVAGVLLVEARLLLLGHPVRAGFGLRRVALVADEPAAPVGDTRTQVGPVLAHLVAPDGHIVRRTLPPAHVLPPDDQVRDEIDIPVLVAARHRRPRRIHRTGRADEPPEVGDHVVAPGPEAREDSPHRHRRVVDVLRDDLPQLFQSVLFELRRGIVGYVAQEGGALQRRIDPHQNPPFVAAVVKTLRMGHHGRTQGVGPQVAQHGQIGLAVLRRERAARGGVVVVERDAAHGNPAAVDPQPARGRRYDRAESRADRNAVRNTVLADRSRDGVERRRFGAPQLRLPESEGHDDRFAVEPCALPLREDRPAVGRGDVERHHAGVPLLRDEVDFGLARNGERIDRLRMDEHTVRAEVEGRHGRPAGHDELHVAVDAAIEVHVGRGGQHVVPDAVADDHQQRVVLPEADVVRDLEREGRGPSAVRTRMAAIDEQVGHRLRAVELHEQPPRSPLPGNVNIVLVVARRFEPAPRRAGIGVPGVRQRDMAGVVARVLRLEEETPPFVERIHLARPGRTGGEDEQQSRKDSFHGGTVF